MSSRRVLGWLLLTSAAALALGGSYLIARRLIAANAQDPSRIIRSCDRLLSDLEARLEGRRLVPAQGKS
jgi:hypothetical protein